MCEIKYHVHSFAARYKLATAPRPHSYSHSLFTGASAWPHGTRSLPGHAWLYRHNCRYVHILSRIVDMLRTKLDMPFFLAHKQASEQAWQCSRGQSLIISVPLTPIFTHSLPDPLCLRTASRIMYMPSALASSLAARPRLIYHKKNTFVWQDGEHRFTHQSAQLALYLRRAATGAYRIQPESTALAFLPLDQVPHPCLRFRIAACTQIRCMPSASKADVIARPPGITKPCSKQRTTQAQSYR